MENVIKKAENHSKLSSLSWLLLLVLLSWWIFYDDRLKSKCKEEKKLIPKYLHRNPGISWITQIQLRRVSCYQYMSGFINPFSLLLTLATSFFIVIDTKKYRMMVQKFVHFFIVHLYACSVKKGVFGNRPLIIISTIITFFLSYRATMDEQSYKCTHK